MEKEETKKEVFQLVEIATATGLAIKTPEGNILSTEEAVVLLLNKVEALEKVVG